MAFSVGREDNGTFISTDGAIVGTSEADALDGGSGADVIYGGSGGDLLTGQGGNDSLFGGDGDDELHGNAGDDRLEGGQGDDKLFGGSDDNLFVFSNGDDADQVTGFQPGAGTDDRLDFSGHSAVGSLGDVQAAATYDGVKTVIDLGGGDSVTLIGVDVADLHQDDFVF